MDQIFKQACFFRRSFRFRVRSHTRSSRCTRSITVHHVQGDLSLTVSSSPTTTRNRSSHLGGSRSGAAPWLCRSTLTLQTIVRVLRVDVALGLAVSRLATVVARNRLTLTCPTRVLLVASTATRRSPSLCTCILTSVNIQSIKKFMNL